MQVTAAEIMTSPVITVTPEMSIAKVTNLMATNNISGLPVVNEADVVVGIISEADIVNYSSRMHVVRLISSSKWVSPYTQITDIASFRKGFEMLSKSKVKDIMFSKVATVRESATGEEIARIMTRRKVNRVPVVDASGRILGIITRANLVKYLAERGG
ncbi:MAG TPA: CBS domain-containing protein [Firmicutes bacterium]|nr:CBS domain-containing protein [Bacillota bacterium]